MRSTQPPNSCLEEKKKDVLHNKKNCECDNESILWIATSNGWSELSWH